MGYVALQKASETIKNNEKEEHWHNSKVLFEIIYNNSLIKKHAKDGVFH